MKKSRVVLLMLMIIVSVKPLYSQFYDIKIVKEVKGVGTRREPPMQIKSNNPENSEINYKRFKKMNGALIDSTYTERSENPVVASDDKTLVQPLFCSPLDTLIVSSVYGYRDDPFTGKWKFHAGTDYVTSSENVYAMMPGRIQKIGYDKKLGNYITIDHGDLTVTYAHLHTVVGRKGDSVFAGQSVGISGSTGRSTGEHLHVNMKYKKKTVDPEPIVRYISAYAKGY